MNNTFILNDYTLNDLKELSKTYKYIIKATDKFLSGWGQAKTRKHIQLILCKTQQEKDHILQDLRSDNTFNYIKWYPLCDAWLSNIIQLKYRYNVSLRNDWSR